MLLLLWVLIGSGSDVSWQEHYSGLKTASLFFCFIMGHLLSNIGWRLWIWCVFFIPSSEQYCVFILMTSLWDLVPWKVFKCLCFHRCVCVCVRRISLSYMLLNWISVLNLLCCSDYKRTLQKFIFCLSRERITSLISTILTDLGSVKTVTYLGLPQLSFYILKKGKINPSWNPRLRQWEEKPSANWLYWLFFKMRI